MAEKKTTDREKGGRCVLKGQKGRSEKKWGGPVKGWIMDIEQKMDL